MVSSDAFAANRDPALNFLWLLVSAVWEPLRYLQFLVFLKQHKLPGVLYSVEMLVKQLVMRFLRGVFFQMHDALV